MGRRGFDGAVEERMRAPVVSDAYLCCRRVLLRASMVCDILDVTCSSTETMGKESSARTQAVMKIPMRERTAGEPVVNCPCCIESYGNQERIYNYVNARKLGAWRSRASNSITSTSDIVSVADQDFNKFYSRRRGPCYMNWLHSFASGSQPVGAPYGRQ